MVCFPSSMFIIRSINLSHILAYSRVSLPWVSVSVFYPNEITVERKYGRKWESVDDFYGCLFGFCHIKCHVCQFYCSRFNIPDMGHSGPSPHTFHPHAFSLSRSYLFSANLSIWNLRALLFQGQLSFSQTQFFYSLFILSEINIE